MATQTQQAFSIIKAGIDRGVQSGIYKSMEEVMELIQAYNILVETNDEQQKIIIGLGKKCEMFESQLKPIAVVEESVMEENHN